MAQASDLLKVMADCLGRVGGVAMQLPIVLPFVSREIPAKHALVGNLTVDWSADEPE